MLTALLKNSDLPKRGVIASAFEKVTSHNLRNVFAHGYIATDKDTVTFIARRRGAKPKTYEFAIGKFVGHVAEFAQAGAEFSDALEEALGMNANALDEFAHAAWEPDDDDD